MNRDRSLEEFLDAESAPDPAAADATASAAGEEREAGRSGDADPAAGLAVRPARSTMDWTPGGADCEACGASAERRWRDGERLVCEACKEW